MNLCMHKAQNEYTKCSAFLSMASQLAAAQKERLSVTDFSLENNFQMFRLNSPWQCMAINSNVCSHFFHFHHADWSIQLKSRQVIFRTKAGHVARFLMSYNDRFMVSYSVSWCLIQHLLMYNGVSQFLRIGQRLSQVLSQALPSSAGESLGTRLHTVQLHVSVRHLLITPAALQQR